MNINIERLNNKINELAKTGRVRKKGINRLALSGYDKTARDKVVFWMQEIGLNIFIDQIGNIIGIRSGKNDLPPVMTGSHIDSVLNAGMYDGVYGVIAGLEVMQTLNEYNIKTNRPLAVTVFSNEEGVRYSPDMMGSMVYSKQLSVEKALKTVGYDGTIYGKELNKIGYTGAIKCGEIKPNSFIELHVEQGPVLYNENTTIGIVDKIVGIYWLEVLIRGESNHTGTTPMNMRKDPAYVSSRIITFLRELTKKEGSNLIATCANINVDPNIINVIPKQVKMTLDWRSRSNQEIEDAQVKINEFVKLISKEEKVTINLKEIVNVSATILNENIINCIEESTKELNYSYRKITSGAGHDAQIMAHICPSAMIFVPSKNGISHNIKEYTEIDDLEAGANVLLKSILKLAN